MTEDQLRQIIAEGSSSPSVHNVQPARWRVEGDTLVLLEDCSRRLKIGDPTGNDAGISLGAAVEGLAIAASKYGFSTHVEHREGEYGALREVARLSFAKGGERDRLVDALAHRASWRGQFLTAEPEDREVGQSLETEGRQVVIDPQQVASLAVLYDHASYSFMRNHKFRAELRSWMRLHKHHPQWSRDGLNAEAMKLSAFEAFGAGLVLGPLFRPLATLGLAPQLLAERKSFGNAVGVVLFHRPRGEPPFESGRHFHRLWLEIEAAGFGANVLAALADNPSIATRVSRDHGIDDSRRLVSAFRFGRRTGTGFAPARLPVGELIVS